VYMRLPGERVRERVTVKGIGGTDTYFFRTHAERKLRRAVGSEYHSTGLFFSQSEGGMLGGGVGGEWGGGGGRQKGKPGISLHKEKL